MRGKSKAVETYALPGMQQDIEAQAEAAAARQGEELTEVMLSPLANVNRMAGEMEADAPLFFGQINGTLF